MQKTIRNDLILIGAVLFAALIAALIILLFASGPGMFVTVTVDRETTAVYPLAESRLVTIKGFDGGECIMKIENGRVTMEAAECPDHICVMHRPIYRPGETIICLPNRVVLTISGDSELDAISR